jgi:hypothetical protein
VGLAAQVRDAPDDTNATPHGPLLVISRVGQLPDASQNGNGSARGDFSRPAALPPIRQAAVPLVLRSRVSDLEIQAAEISRMRHVHVMRLAPPDTRQAPGTTVPP